MAIDPGTGSSSPTGIAIFDANSREILFHNNLWAVGHKELHHRIASITSQLAAILSEIDPPYLVCIEQFVMRGKGGESLQRMVGAYLSAIPINENVELLHVQNTKVKLMLAGHGHADKASVAVGVSDFFSPNEGSYKLVKDLTHRNEFDIIDALAIGVTGWKISTQQA